MVQIFPFCAVSVSVAGTVLVVLQQSQTGAVFIKAKATLHLLHDLTKMKQ